MFAKGSIMKLAGNLSRLLLTCAMLLAANVNAESILKPVSLGNGVYALIGAIGAREPVNMGLNANYGVVDTPQGTILIDSGASSKSAALLEKEATSLTGKPVKWVINTGSQDHRWLGNGYFINNGVEVIALSRTVETQKKLGLSEIDALTRTLGDQMAGTHPAYAQKPIAAETKKLVLGGRQIEINYFGDAHFSGDATVLLPKEKIAFSGDLIYVDRLLGILPESNAKSWLSAFNRFLRLNPRVIVPGHGSVTDVVKAQKDTGNYLFFIVNGTQTMAEDMAGVDKAVQELGDANQFSHLANYNELHKGNVSRAYLRLEGEQ